MTRLETAGRKYAFNSSCLPIARVSRSFSKMVACGFTRTRRTTSSSRTSDPEQRCGSTRAPTRVVDFGSPLEEDGSSPSKSITRSDGTSVLARPAPTVELHARPEPAMSSDLAGFFFLCYSFASSFPMFNKGDLNVHERNR